MFNISKTFAAAIALSLSGVFSSAALLPASAVTYATVEVTADSGETVSNESRSAESTRLGGLKAAKAILKGFVASLRSGRADDVIDAFGRDLDDGARAALKNNSHEVADALEEAVDYLDLPAKVVKSRIFNALESKIGGGSANVIAEAAYIAVSIAL